MLDVQFGHLMPQENRTQNILHFRYCSNRSMLLECGIQDFLTSCHKNVATQKFRVLFTAQGEDKMLNDRKALQTHHTQFLSLINQQLLAEQQHKVGFLLGVFTNSTWTGWVYPWFSTAELLCCSQGPGNPSPGNKALDYKSKGWRGSFCEVFSLLPQYNP